AERGRDGAQDLGLRGARELHLLEQAGVTQYDGRMLRDAGEELDRLLALGQGQASETDREETDERVLAIERGQDGGRERPAARAEAGRALGLGAGQHDERLRGEAPDRRP